MEGLTMTQKQNLIQAPPMVNCANGHACNQYVTTCRICGADVPKLRPAAPAGLNRLAGVV